MKRKLLNRLAWILTISMLLTLFPATSLAAGLPAPTGLKLGTARIGDFQYASTFTQLYVQWNEIEAMQNFYKYQAESDYIVSGSGIRFSVMTQGNRVGPLANPFGWMLLNGSSIDYHINKITVSFLDDNDNPGPSAVLNTDISIRQVEETERLTAYYIGTETVIYDGGSYDKATFQIPGVPPEHSADFLLKRSGGGSAGAGTGTGTGSSSTGVVTISDHSYMKNGQKSWSMSLGDMEVNDGDEYCLDVYNAHIDSNTKASMTITRYPVDIVFDSLDITVGGPLVYTGSQINPVITVETVEETPELLVKDVDYTLSFEKNGTPIAATEIRNAGTYTAVVEGKSGTAYEGKTARKSFVVAKAAPGYAVPAGLTATYGETLAGVDLPAGFTWQNPDSTSVGNAGTNTFLVKYTPADTGNYNEVSNISVSITVSKADQTPVLALSSETGMIGLTPPALHVSGAGGTGAFHYTSSNPGVAAVDEATGEITILSAGSTTLTVTKDGDSNYNASGESAGVVLTVKNKVNLTVKDTAATDETIAAEWKNQGKISVGTPVRTGVTNNFTVAVKGKTALSAYTGSDMQAEAKWFGLLIGNVKVNDGSAYPITNLFYKVSADTEAGYIQFTPAHEGAGLLAGGTDKEFVYWIRSDVDPTTVIWLATSESGENETKLTVNFTPYQASSSGGGGGGNAKTQIEPASAEPKTTTVKGTTTVSTTVTASTNALGIASAAVPAVNMAGLVEKAREAENQNKNAVIEINVNMSAGANAAEVLIGKAAFDSIVKTTKAEVRVETDLGSVTFDAKALSSISEGSTSGDISIQMKKLDVQSLNDSVKSVVGDRPVYDFTVMAGNEIISAFNGGTASISIPYALKPGEDKNAVVVYFIDDSGNLQTVRGAFNEKTGKVDFKVSHFSKYAIGYNKITFTDIKDGAWYSDAVTFLSARGITTGTSANTFSPGAAISRAEFLVMAMRAYGIEPMKNSTDNFADAGNSYYSDYLAAAKKMKITRGVGDNLYKPNEKISRQDMFTLLYRALDVMNEIPSAEKDGSLDAFSDSDSVAGYAKSAAETLVSAGVISGSGGKLDPTGLSTRAQMAQILQNLMTK